jgi:hypothetical protein
MPGPTRRKADRDMPAEIDFSAGVRGKFAARLASMRMIYLDPDVAAAFPTSAAVNAALRSLAKTRKPTRKPARRKAS